LQNSNATKAHISTAIPLSLGYLLAYGEWELLTFFAAFLGPAEVSAWGVLGTVWDVLEETTEAIAEAGEVRCAFLLGAGRPYHAAMSAAKSTVFAFIFAVLLACIVLICGDNLAVWMTSDPTLQKLVADLIPLFALGNVTLTVGTMAWVLVGAQGRYALSTSVGFVGSWCVTIPLAAMYTIWLEISLQGQTSAVVIGYMVSGTWNTYYLLMSDWKAISAKVVAYNNANGIDLDSDQESSSNGNSSISSADE
jgi:Na+-driven multidrug efflux pump